MLQRIRRVLTEAEQELAKLASEAAAQRDYDAAAVAIDVAKEVGTISARFAAVSSNALASDEIGDAEASLQSTVSRSGTRAIVRPQSSKKGNYPRFLREGDYLIKVAWSKTERSEYEHKSPKGVLNALVPAIARFGAGGKRFTMDAVLPLKDASGSEVPDYQTYLCLAWLRTMGLIKQHGRQGYSLPRNGDISNAAESEWNRLSTR
jgi:hypothetical protein